MKVVLEPVALEVVLLGDLDLLLLDITVLVGDLALLLIGDLEAILVGLELGLNVLTVLLLGEGNLFSPLT